MSLVSLELIVPAWRRPARDASSRPSGPGATADGGTGIDGLVWTSGGALTWQGALMRSLGLESGNGAEVPGANAWTEDIEPAMPPHRVLRADPVHLEADRDTAMIVPPEALALDADEAGALGASLDEFLREDGLALHRGSPERWYVAATTDAASGLLPPRCHFPAQRLARLRASDFLEPRGGEPARDDPEGAADAAAQRRLRGLESEIEMLLHAHPVNAARAASGRPTVTGLHFWGASRPWRALDSSLAVARSDAVVATDPFSRAATIAARALLLDAGVYADFGVGSGSSRRSSDGSFDPVRALGASEVPARVSVVDLSVYDAWLRGDETGERTARERVTECWVHPAVEAIRSAVPMELVIAGDDGELGRFEETNRGSGRSRYRRGGLGAMLGRLFERRPA